MQNTEWFRSTVSTVFGFIIGTLLNNTVFSQSIHDLCISRFGGLAVGVWFNIIAAVVFIGFWIWWIKKPIARQNVSDREYLRAIAELNGISEESILAKVEENKNKKKSNQ